MTRYLIVADADKIQDFVFRSARLRQVAGGSQLLAHFCATFVPALLERHGESAETAQIVSAGGSFRFTFEDEETARAFADDLAAAYHHATDGTLTIAGPITYTEGQFATQNEAVQHQLRRAKRTHRGVHAVEQLPIMAVCASCGSTAAAQHGRLPGEDMLDGTTARFLCSTCIDKAESRHQQRPEFFSAFRNAIRTINPQQEMSRLDDRGVDVDYIAQFDPGGYVAYIVADGNGMGQLFRACSTVDQLRDLSDRLEAAMWQSFAAPTTSLLENQDALGQINVHGDGRKLPVVPMIAGGDDMLALVPARYALDMARVLCATFQREMGRAVDEMGLDVARKPTIGAAVIICKSNYPYKLAYNAGKPLLKHTKELAKSLPMDVAASAVAFRVITGNALNDSDWVTGEAQYRPTLQPYWVLPEDDDPQTATVRERLGNYGVFLDDLIQQRHMLRNLPQKRRVEFRSLFEEQLRELTPIRRWNERMNGTLKRFRQVHPDLWKPLHSSLAALGKTPDRGDFVWRSIARPGEEAFSAHGLADLIAAWDYAFDLQRRPIEYEAEVR